MPWCFWGYSILAKGARAQELLLEVFKCLSLGPAAVPKLVAKTPKVPLPARSRQGWILGTLALLTAGFGLREYVLLKRRRTP